MSETVHFIDTTTRDGSQSNWAAGMPVGMMDAVMEDLDKVGYRALDIPYMPLQFKKIVRDLKEDPWEMIKMIGKKAPNTVKGSMLGPGLRVFDTGGNNREATTLFLKLLAEYGVLQRVQLMSNINNASPTWKWFIDLTRKLGAEIVYGVCYYIGTTRHTDELYARKTREAVELGADVIYLKDAGGLLDVESVRRVMGIMRENANGIPLEIHSHCTAGMADAVYAEAVKQGCRGFHTGIPPLAEGTAQPTIANTAENMRALGFDIGGVDIERAESISKRMYRMAKEEGLPTDFGPTRYQVAQYIHRIPGGVASNMRHQLKELHLEDRVDEVTEECVRICAEMGEPHMITPYSQYVCTQAAINVALGERYKVVIDDFIKYALGFSGPESGSADMDPNLRDRFCGLPRAEQLKEIARNSSIELNKPLKDLRNEYGAANLSDEEFLLRYMMKGTEEIDAMRAVTKEYPFHRYTGVDSPIIDLIDELSRQPKITQLQVQFQDKTLTLAKESL
ncbi:MAG: hypothetical protein FWG28_05360 [Clostridiales bacterium]|nr:hypothetical protein [Clostridiales bacterium]